MNGKISPVVAMMRLYSVSALHSNRERLLEHMADALVGALYLAPEPQDLEDRLSHQVEEWLNSPAQGISDMADQYVRYLNEVQP